MTVEEFINELNELRERPTWKYNKDKIVRVRTHDVSVGPRPSSNVTNMAFGFDWDNNTFFIYTEDKLTKKPEPAKMCRYCASRYIETVATHNSRGYDLCEACYKTRLAAEIESEKQQEEFYRRNI